MCGIVGIVSQNNVNQELFDALTVLQHRGQDAAGIVTCDDGHLRLCKGNGMVREVFHTRHMQQLSGPMGLAHVRYPTAGSDSQAEAQPFYVNSPYGISLAHNGNLTNAELLKSELFKADRRHINTDSDSEIILNILAHALQQNRRLSPTPEDFFSAVTELHQRCRGGYAVVSMITDMGILAFRDPNGIRPLVIGKRTIENQDEYMIASESVALGPGHFTLIGDVAPGEAVFIDKQGSLHRKICTEAPHAPCIFEFVYLARPDSVMEGASIYKVRLNTGQALAEDILKQWPDHDIDVVIPVPETSRSSAVSLASTLKVPFREGFVKNRYIGRTFIMPGQETRKKSVRQKLNAMEMEFHGKNVLLVDDSIVRGTTSKEIIQMARESGATNVYFASASPPIRYPNIYGIDMPVAQELIAHDHSVEEVAEAIGADRLFYLDLEDLKTALLAENPSSTTFDTSIFDGKYVTGDETDYLKAAAKKRANSTKTSPKNQSPLDLHNHSSES